MITVERGGYYEILGVPRDASPAEIRKAYLRKVREHPPERDPEGFRRVQEAWDCLRDPRARAEYDRQWFEDPGSRELLARAQELLDEEDPGALPVLKRLLARNPDSALVLDLLALAFLQRGELVQALRRARRAVDLDPRNPGYRGRLAQVLADLGRLEEAVREGERVMTADPGNLSVRGLVAKLLFLLGRLGEARRVLREGLAAPADDPMTTLQLYQLLRVVNLRARDEAETISVQREMMDWLPEDPDLAAHAAWSCLNDARLAAELGLLEAASVLAGDAAGLDDSSPEAAAVRDQLKQALVLVEELGLLRDDPVIEPTLRAALVVLVRAPWEATAPRGPVAKLKVLVEGEGYPWPRQRALLRVRYPAVTRTCLDYLRECDMIAERPFKTKVYLLCPRCGESGVGVRGEGLVHTCPRCGWQVGGDGRRGVG